MKAGQNVDAVHPVSGQWEKATVVHPPAKVGIQKDRETVAVVRFDRDGYQVEQPTLYIQEK